MKNYQTFAQRRESELVGFPYYWDATSVPAPEQPGAFPVRREALQNARVNPTACKQTPNSIMGITPERRALRENAIYENLRCQSRP